MTGAAPGRRARAALTLALLLVVASGARAQGIPECRTFAAAEAAFGQALRTFWFSTVRPLVAQSQACPAPQRVTDQEARDVMAGVMAAMGCGTDTPAFWEYAALLRTTIPDGTVASLSIVGIPWHYLSSDPGFCERPGIEAMATCTVDLDCPLRRTLR